jgi:hypothetical protein
MHHNWGPLPTRQQVVQEQVGEEGLLVRLHLTGATEVGGQGVAGSSA